MGICLFAVVVVDGGVGSRRGLPDVAVAGDGGLVQFEGFVERTARQVE